MLFASLTPQTIKDTRIRGQTRPDMSFFTIKTTNLHPLFHVIHARKTRSRVPVLVSYMYILSVHAMCTHRQRSVCLTPTPSRHTMIVWVSVTLFSVQLHNTKWQGNISPWTHSFPKSDVSRVCSQIDTFGIIVKKYPWFRQKSDTAKHHVHFPAEKPYSGCKNQS